jgi:hypothetical protein
MNLGTIRRTIDLNASFQAQPGDYARLADENDEQGQVNVYRKNGSIVMTMPREVWDQLLGFVPEKQS